MSEFFGCQQNGNWSRTQECFLSALLDGNWSRTRECFLSAWLPCLVWFWSLGCFETGSVAVWMRISPYTQVFEHVVRWWHCFGRVAEPLGVCSSWRKHTTGGGLRVHKFAPLPVLLVSSSFLHMLEHGSSLLPVPAAVSPRLLWTFKSLELWAQINPSVCCLGHSNRKLTNTGYHIIQPGLETHYIPP